MAYVFLASIPTGFAVFEDHDEVFDKRAEAEAGEQEWMDLRTVEGPILTFKIALLDAVVEDKKT